MEVAIVLTGVLLLFLVISILGAEYMFRFAITRKGVKAKGFATEEEKRIWKEYTKYFEEGEKWVSERKPCEWTIQSEDGLTLYGYFLKAQQAKRTVICVHGYRGNGIRDFGTIAKFYYENQSNVVIIDQRAHGKSEGRYLCYGIKERYDVLGWIHKVNEEVEEELPIYLDGVSMGAATVLYTTGLSLPANVVGVIADCGYTSPGAMFRHMLKTKIAIPKFPIYYLANVMCKRRAGFWFDEIKTTDALKDNTRPILFVHGKLDEFVPTSMSYENYEASQSKKKIAIVEGAGHAQSYYVDMKACQKELMEFFDSTG